MAGVTHFQAAGYHGTGLTAILETAGAPKGSFYHHYPGGKEQLAAEIVSWLADEVDGFLRSLDATGRTGSEMVLAMADYAMRGLEQSPAARGSLITVMAAEVAPTVPAVRDALQDAIRHWIGFLSAGAEREGRQDPAAWSHAALAQLEGASTMSRIAADPETVRRLVSTWLHASRPG